jgi:hypothetical protein
MSLFAGCGDTAGTFANLSGSPVDLLGGIDGALPVLMRRDVT